MNVPNEKVQRIAIHLVELAAPTRLGGHETMTRLRVGDRGVKDMELYERRGCVRVIFENGLIVNVPIANMTTFVETNEAAQKKFQSHKQQTAAPVEPPPPPKPVKSDVVKL